MIRPVALDHIVLRTERYRELVAFYCEVLGCVLERATSDDLGLTQLRAGTALIDVVDINGQLGRAGGGPPRATDNNMDHFCLQIEPFEEGELIAYLDARGVQHSGFEERYGARGFGRSIYLKDIAGNTVELRASSAGRLMGKPESVARTPASPPCSMHEVDPDYMGLPPAVD